MDNFVHLPMFLYKGNRKWQSTVKEFSEKELSTLFYCIEEALDTTHDIEARREIVFLLEKLYKISDIVDTDELNNNTL